MDPQSQQPNINDQNRVNNSANSTPQPKPGEQFGVPNDQGNAPVFKGFTPISQVIQPTDSGAPMQPGSISRRKVHSFIKLGPVAVIFLILLLLGVLGSMYLLFGNKDEQALRTPDSIAKDFAVAQIPLTGLIKDGQISIDSTQQLSVNGQLRANNSFVIAPTSEPQNPTSGQIYYSQASNELFYYDGANFVSLATNQAISNLGLGAISSLSDISDGLVIQGQTLVNSGVLSVQGQSGAVTLTSGGGIGINGLTITNTGVTGINGTANQISVSAANGNVTLALPQSISAISTPTFAGLNLGSPLAVGSGGTGVTAFAANSVIVSNGSGGLAASGSGIAGQCLLANGAGVTPSFQACPGGGGNVSAGALQTAGRIVKWDAVSNQIVDSILSENAGVITVGGSLGVTGSISGDGADLTNLEAGDIASGTLSDARLSSNVTLQGNTFNGASQLVQLNASTQLPAVSGVNLTNLNASNVASGTLGTSFGGTGAGSFTTNGVLYGNNTGALLATAAGSTGQCLMAGVGGVPSFQACPVGGNISSGISQTAGAITKFDAATNQITDSLLAESAGTITASGNFTITGTPRLSALSTGILHADASGNVTSSLVNLGTEVAGTLSDARLSANVALLNAAQTFTGANTFNNASNSFTGNGSGLINVNAAQLNGQIGSFYQNASNINAGTLGVGFGGTGQTSYTDGQLLIGNSATSGLSKATLTAGSGVTIVNGNGSITISAPNAGSCGTCANVALSNLTSPTAINQSLLTDGSATIDLGSASNAFRDLYLNNQLSLLESGATPSFRGNLAVGDLSGNQSYTLNEGGTVVTSGNVASYATTGVTAGNGLTGGGTTGSLTLNVVAGTGVQVNANDIEVLYGAIAGTAVQGNTQATVTAGTNLTGGGTITLGSGGSITVNTVNNPTFSTSVTTPLLNLTSAGFTGALQPTTLTANQTYTLPDQSGTVCLSTGNCPSGGNIYSGTAQTAGNLVKFDTTTNEITNSIASESGSKITIGGTLDVTGASTITLGSGSSNSGSLLFKNSANNSTLTLQSGATGSNLTFTLPTADGGNGQCLKTNASGVLSFGDCLTGAGGGSGGVVSLNGLSGSLSLANASGVGSTVTIDNASTSAKGIAQFNATNFTASSGTINTIQDIATTSSPTFASTTFNSNLRVLEDGGSPSFYGSFNVADLSADQTYTFNEGGNVVTSGNVASNAVTAVTAAGGLTGGGGPGAINLSVGAGTGITVNADDIAVIYGAIAGSAVQGNTQMTVTAGTNLSGGGTVTLGSGGSVTVNTVNNPTFSTSVTTPMLVLSGAGSNGTIQVANLGQATTYTLPDPGAASATICLSTGNCAGAGGGITGTGTPGALAKFTAAGIIGDSVVSESGSVVTISGTLAVTGASTVTLGSASNNTGSLLFKNATNNNTLTLQSGATGSNLTFTLPTADGASGECLKTNASGVLSFGACLSGAGGGGGGVVSLNGLSGTLSLANASGVGSTVTIDNASTSVKGIAQFNATNFTASSGTINTIQDIATTASPTFATLTATTELRVLEDGGSPTNYGTLNVATLSADQTYTLNEGGTVITTGNVANNAVTAVSAGDGLTGGGGPGSVTLNVVAGNGITVNPNDITLALQANKGLEVDANGLSLIDCGDNQILKYSTGTNQWSCQADAGGSGLGDNITVNSTAATDANFLDVAATGTITGTAWSINTASNPDDITIAISNASDTQAGAVTTGVQTFGGAKTFNGQITAGAGIDLANQTLAGTTAVINFTNFDVSSAGALTAVGVDAGTGLIQNTGGLTTTGTASINTTGTAASSIGNGTGALALTGSSSSTFVLNGTTVSAAEFNILDGGLDLSTETNGNYVATITAGAGLTGDVASHGSTPTLAVASANGGIVVNADNIQLTLQASTDALSSTTSSGSGLEVLAGGLTMLQGCANNEILKWNETTDVWACAADTLQNAYNNDVDTGTDPNVTIGLTSADGSLIVQNPSSSGTAAGYVMKVENLNTGAVEGLRIESAGTGSLFTVRDTTTTAQNVLTIADGGATTLRNQTDSATAFLVQNTAAQNLFQIDTSNNNIVIGGNNSGALQPWVSTTAINVAGSQPRSGGMSVAANGYIYKIGGDNASAVPQSTVYYAKQSANGILGSWTAGSNTLPGARSSASIVTANGYVYIIGGYDTANNAQSTVYYAKLNGDGTTSAWQTSNYDIGCTTPGCGSPAVRAEHTSVVANGYVYVIAGSTTSTPQSTVYYAKLNADGSTGAWTTNSYALGCATQGCGSPVTRFAHSSVTANGYVYVIGGWGGASEQSTIYYAKLNADGSTGAWTANSYAIGCATAGCGSPVGRYAHSTVVANGNVYVIGGATSVTTFNTIYYAGFNSDGSIGAWASNANTFTTARMYHASVILNGYVYVLGGWDGANELDSVYYTSTQRITLGGTLDLVGLGGENTADGETGTGGELTAGNTHIIGSLDVRGQSSFMQGVSVDKELVVNGSALFKNATDSTTAFQIQDSTGGQIFNADTSTTPNLFTNGSFESGTTGWTAKTGTTIARNTTEKYIGNASLAITADAADEGVKYNYTFTNGVAYNVSFMAKLASGTMTTLAAGRADNGSTESNCTSGGTIYPGGWKRIVCNFTAGAQSGTPYFYIKQTDATSRTFYIDAVQVTLDTLSWGTAFTEGELTLNGIVDSPTVFRNQSNSSQAFAVQDTIGSTLLNVNTLHGRVEIGAIPNPADPTNAGLATLTINSWFNNDNDDEARLIVGENAASGSNNPSGSGILKHNSGTNMVHLGAFDSGGTYRDILTYKHNGEGVTLQNNWESANTNLIIQNNATSAIIIKPTGASQDNATAIQLQNGSGNAILTINTSTPGVILGGGVTGGTLTADIAGTGTSHGLCHGTGNTATENVSIVDCNANPLADYAEAYPVADGTSYGDIVAIGNTMVNTYDTTDGNIDWTKVKGQITQLVKSTSSHQANAIGIASDNHGDFTSAGHNIKPEDNPMPVALNGRVPVNVSASSDPIQPGDYLTTSTDPGKATKATGAGYVIGKALASWTPGQANVMVFVEPGYYNGPNMSDVIQNGGNATLANLNVTGTANFANLNVSGSAILQNLTVNGIATIAALTVTGNATFQGDILVNGHIVTGGGEPTIQSMAGAGSGSSVAVEGTDTAGTIVVTTGSSPAPGELAKVVFSKNYGAAPRAVISPANDAAGGLRYFKGTATVDDFILNAKDAPAPNTEYKFDYFIAQ